MADTTGNPMPHPDTEYSDEMPADRIAGGGLWPAIDRRWLIMLAIVDLALIAAHIVLGAMLPTIPPVFNIAFDHGLGESFNYAKWAAIVGGLGMICHRTRSPAFAACALVFLAIFMDDAFQIHERLGHVLATSVLISEKGVAGSQNLGELIIFAMVAGLLAPVIALGVLMSGRKGRMAALRIIGLLALLTFFGVGVDQVHGAFRGLPYGMQIADLLEEGGEMLVASVIVAHIVAILQRAGRHMAPERY